MTVITISIITYKRPASLAATLESLRKIIIPCDTKVNILVVDNDSGESARGTVNAAKEEMPFAVQYEVEGKRGIPHARNHALAAAFTSDYIAFMDDDDTADPQWLAALYGTMLTCSADVVKGQVHYIFPEDKPYLSKLDIFAPMRAPTGSELDSAWTNNVLFSTRLYKEKGLLFDSAFLNTGGSDHHFFRQAKNAGARIVLCQEAIVQTRLPPERTTWRWLARRHMRVGATITISDVRMQGHRYAFENAVPAIWDSAKYFSRLLPGVFSGINPAIHPCMVVSFMLGRITGLFHISPREYK